MSNNLESLRVNKYRNYLCPCRSGKKYKKCCYQKDQGFINKDIKELEEEREQ